MILTELQQALLLTLAYTLQFEFPLTTAELRTRLVGRLDQSASFFFSARTPSVRQITQAVAELQARGWLIQMGHYWMLPGFEASGATRQRRAAISRSRSSEIERFVAMAQRLPWITSVFVTGSLAMENAELEEDIDFLLVTQTHRLWLSRLVVALVAWLLGKRRTRNQEGRQSWCFNLWLEETELGVFSQRQSIYTAYELMQARCVFDREGRPDRLMAANPWVREFLPNAVQTHSPTPRLTNRHSPALRPGWRRALDPLLEVANWFMYHLQLCYMWSHMTREYVSPTVAFFHPRDTQGWIVRRWAGVLNRAAESYDERSKHPQSS
jgi:hypothetical protein